MNQQSAIQTVAKNFKGLILASVLYPLDRIQSIQQVTSTYSNTNIKNSPSIIGQAIHYGRRSYFRGYMPFLMKTSLLTATCRVTDLSQQQNMSQWTYSDNLSMGLGLLGYSLLYPLEIINIRMSVQVQLQRFYSNVRECISKVKKNEGIKTFYRGYFFGSIIFLSQLAAIKMGGKYLNLYENRYSQWQKVGILLGLIGLSEIFFYPFMTIKKLFQVNGSIGHTNYNFSILRTIQANSISSLFKGISTRMSNLALYGLLYCVLMEQ